MIFEQWRVESGQCRVGGWQVDRGDWGVLNSGETRYPRRWYQFRNNSAIFGQFRHRSNNDAHDNIDEFFPEFYDQ